MKIAASIIVLLIAASSFGQKGLPEGARIVDFQYSPFVHYVLDGKMGLMKEDSSGNFSEVLPAQYDLIMFNNYNEELGVVQNGEIKLIDLNTHNQLGVSAKNRLAEFDNREFYTVGYKIDETYYNSLYGEEKKLSEMSDDGLDRIHYALEPWVIEKINEEEYLVKIKEDWERERVALMSIEYPGEDSITADGNVAYEPRRPSIAGIFSIKSMDWIIDFDQKEIFEMNDKYVIIRESDSLKEKESKNYFYYEEYSYSSFVNIQEIGIVDKNYNTVLEFKDIDELNGSDTLKFLPAGSEIFPNRDGQHLYYKKDNKIGVYKFDLAGGRTTEIAKPEYDFITYHPTFEKFLAYKDGQFAQIKGPEPYYYDQTDLPKIPEEYIKLIGSYSRYSYDYDYYGYGDYNSGDQYAVIDDEKYFKPNYKDWEPLGNRMMDNGSDELSIYKLDDERIVVQYSEYVEPIAIKSVWDPLMDSIDNEGNVVYYPTVPNVSGVFNTNTKTWEKEFQYCSKTENGFIVGKGEGPYASYGVYDLKLKKEIIPFEHEWIINMEDIYRVSKGENSVMYDLKGKKLFEAEGYPDYRGGYFFYAGGPLFDEYGYDSLDNEGNVVYAEQFLRNKKGKKVKCEDYDGMKLMDDGILMITEKGGDPYNRLIGLYDLDKGVVIVEPSLKFSTETPVSSGVYWVMKEDDKHYRYQVGRDFKALDNEGYDQVYEMKEPGVYEVRKGDNIGYLRINGEVILPCEYQYGEPYDVEFGSGAASIFIKDGKHGIYDLSLNKFILPTEYDELTINARHNEMSVKKDGKYGLINLYSFDEEGNFEWELEPKYDGELSQNYPFYTIKIDSLYGLLDSNGNQLLPAEYYFIDVVSSSVIQESKTLEHAAIVTKGDKYLKGIYKDGEQLLPCQYYDIKQTGNKNQLILRGNNEDGIAMFGVYDFVQRKFIHKTKYQYIEQQNYYGDRFWIRDNGKFGLYDKDGKEIIPKRFEEYYTTLRLRSGTVLVKEKGSFGVYDLDSNRYMIPPEFDSIVNFNYSRLLLVRNDGNYGLFDTYTGAPLIQVKYDTIVDLGMYVCTNSRGKTDVYSENDGKTKRVLKEIDVLSSENGFIIYKQSGKKYIFNLYTGEGKEFNYDRLVDMDGGNRFYAYSGDKIGIYDVEENREILAPKYDFIEELDGYYVVGNVLENAVLDISPYVGVADWDGKLVVPIDYKIEGSSYHGIRFIKDGKFYYLNDGEMSEF